MTSHRDASNALIRTSFYLLHQQVIGGILPEDKARYLLAKRRMLSLIASFNYGCKQYRHLAYCLVKSPSYRQDMLVAYFCL